MTRTRTSEAEAEAKDKDETAAAVRRTADRGQQPCYRAMCRKIEDPSATVAGQPQSMPRLDAGVDGGVEGGPKAPSEVSRVNHLQPPPGRGGGALSDTPHSTIRTAGS